MNEIKFQLYAKTVCCTSKQLKILTFFDELRSWLPFLFKFVSGVFQEFSQNIVHCFVLVEGLFVMSSTLLRSFVLHIQRHFQINFGEPTALFILKLSFVFLEENNILLIFFIGPRIRSWGHRIEFFWIRSLKLNILVCVDSHLL